MFFRFIQKQNISQLPRASGVYAFKKGREFLYIGKAINIRERVKNHFNFIPTPKFGVGTRPVFKDTIFVPETEKIGFIQTNSEIEALLLEADLIKKYQPKYNQQWKDSKNYFYIAISDEDFPKVFITHQLGATNSIKQMANNKKRKPLAISPMLLVSMGPFVDGKALKQTLRVLRKVFPFRTCRNLPQKPCLYYDLKLCSAPCFKPQNSYRSNIARLTDVLRGKKQQVVKKLAKEMAVASQKQDFEKAKELRDQIRSLENVFEHSWIMDRAKLGPESGTELSSVHLLEKALGIKGKIKRIEGYDISNIQGESAVGAMVVFENGQANKSQYRKFKIKIDGKPDDTAMLKEVIIRRLGHNEWPMPEVMLIDGGRGQLNAAISAIKQFNNSTIKVIALAKRNNELFIEHRKRPVLLKDLPADMANLILRIRDQAHRFAIAYHKNLRSKKFLS